MRTSKATAELDARLIRALHRDGRASIRSLAASAEAPRAQVSSRIRSLVSTGTIRVIGVIDPGLLGHHVLAHLSIEVSGPLGPIARDLLEADQTVLVSVVSGQYALVVEVWVASMSELYTLIERFRTIPDVRSVNTLTYSDVIKGFFTSNYSGQLSLDPVDYEIMRLLGSDARMSFRALSEHVHLSPSAVTARVSRLLEHHAIKISVVEARSFSNRQLSVGVGLKLNSHARELVAAIRADETIDFAASTVGRFDAIATIVESNSGALYESLERLRAFADVETLECWTHLAVLKEDYTRSPVSH